MKGYDDGSHLGQVSTFYPLGLASYLIPEPAFQSDPKNPNSNPNRSSKIPERVLYCIEQVWIPESDRVYLKPKVLSEVTRTYVYFNPNQQLSSNM